MKNQIVTLLLAGILALGFVLGITPSPKKTPTSDLSSVPADSITEYIPAEDRQIVSPTSHTGKKKTLSYNADTDSVDAEVSGAAEDIPVSLPVFPDNAVPLATYINGRLISDGASALIPGDKDIPYTSLEVFADALGFDVGKIVCADGDCYIVSGDRCIPCSCDDLGVTVRDFSAACVPASALASAAGLSCVINGGDLIFYGVPSFPSAEDVYAEEDLYWLSRIISAESRGEPFEGQLAVGCVVLNRTRCKSYPDTVKDVVFDNKFGIQFTPAYTGSVNNPPTESCVIAAKLCLEGFSLSDSILFFFNSSIAAGSWITSNRTYTMTVGRHDFYS